MALLDAAAIAKRLKNDNRTVVGSADPGDPTKDFVATDVGKVGTTYGLANASTDTSAAYSGGVAEGKGKIVVVHGNGGLTKNDLRTQWFHVGPNGGSYDSTKVGFGAKRCFVNLQGWPLKTNGTKAASVADAQDADAGPLTALGEAVTNYAQVYKTDGTRTPVPGVYTADRRATSLYAPYVGWTSQQVPPATP